MQRVDAGNGEDEDVWDIEGKDNGSRRGDGNVKVPRTQKGGILGNKGLTVRKGRTRDTYKTQI